ncbi:MAG: cation:proton antiporter [Pseudonocardiales bacterium]|nr:cation:proton antiporter [Pseudonocardiales bacterium]MBV9029348.1 cation:proton antiporter [Pseudonocardiales bacterium]
MTGPGEGATVTPQSPPPRWVYVVRTLRALVPIVALIAVGVIHFISEAVQLGEIVDGGGFLVVKFLLAIVLIIAAGSLGGRVAGRVGQPRVVGEMMAGIALGPSLLGQFAPGAEHWLFPLRLIPHLSLIAQLTIIVFVFLLGADLPLGLLRGSGRRVTVLGVGMVAIPVMCGILLADGILSRQYRPAGVALAPFLLFVGVSTGVTAFPVLVRILDEHGLVRSKIGALGLTAAGIGDAIAWCLLAVAVAAIHDDSATVAIRTVALLIVFAGAVWIVFRPALRQFLAFTEKNAAARAGLTPVLLLSAVGGAFITERIGVHAIFGAFLVGMAVPRKNILVQDLTKAVERGIAVILPLFFAVVGLEVQVGFLGNPQDLLACGLMIVTAMASKIGTTTLIARLTKLTWRDSVGLGLMMNCRGLTELVVITTGLSLGIIRQDLFVIFVVMTLVTTTMTGPLLGRLKLGREDSSTEPAVQGPEPAGSEPSQPSRARQPPLDRRERDDRQHPSQARQDDLEHLEPYGGRVPQVPLTEVHERDQHVQSVEDRVEMNFSAAWPRY